MCIKRCCGVAVQMDLWHGPRKGSQRRCTKYMSLHLRCNAEETDVARCWQRSGGRGTSSESCGWSPAHGSPSPVDSLRPPDGGKNSLVNALMMYRWIASISNLTHSSCQPPSKILFFFF